MLLNCISKDLLWTLQLTLKPFIPKNHDYVKYDPNRTEWILYICTGKKEFFAWSDDLVPWQRGENIRFRLWYIRWIWCLNLILRNLIQSHCTPLNKGPLEKKYEPDWAKGREDMSLKSVLKQQTDGTTERLITICRSQSWALIITTCYLYIIIFLHIADKFKKVNCKIAIQVNNILFERFFWQLRLKI